MQKINGKLSIKELDSTGPLPYDLLLNADPSKEQIEKYITSSRVFIAELNGQTIGCFVLFAMGHGSVEIKNIAVHEGHRNKGVGHAMLKGAIEKAGSMGFKRIVIGTGNSSIGQLYLYQKVGFRITAVLKDFFKDNYPEPIIENGIPCVDMVVLAMEL